MKNVLSITIPTSWNEIEAPLLRYVARLMAAGFTMEQVKNYAILRHIPQDVLKRLNPAHLAVAQQYLNFLDTPPTVPVRPSHLGKGTAIDKEFHNVPFATYLVIENLWQGTLETLQEVKDVPSLGTPPAAALELLTYLYEGYDKTQVKPWHIIILLLWMQGLKSYLALTFPHLFHKADTTDNAAVNMREVMESEIRALTGGDITKREEVLKADTWAALTELDAKAREAEELNKK